MLKFLPGIVASLVSTREMRTNLRSLMQYIAFLIGAIVAYAVTFHLIMGYEGQSHSWVTGLYWVLVVMTTLGFGDITFESDIGRIFTIWVLVSGVVMLLVMLPFQFIRLFYAPWLDARMRSRTPRAVSDELRGHVIITRYDVIVPELVRRLSAVSDAYVLLEPDPDEAQRLSDEGFVVVTGPRNSVETYRALGADRAQMVVANAGDTDNTNVTLTVREINEQVPITAVVEEDDSIDVLELSGASHLLPLTRQLGEFLANRIHVPGRGAHIVGNYQDLLVAELPATDADLVGPAVKDTHLRERVGVNIIGVWSSGQLRPVDAATVIEESDVLVVTGTQEAFDQLDQDRPPGPRGQPVLVIGAGRVGRAAVAYLHGRGVRTYVVDREEDRRNRISQLTDRMVIGDAADRSVIEAAGVLEVSSVILTTNDDAMNIYLAVYCRRLNPALRIVSRITDERNVEAIHRAGADFVLSYASLGAEAIFSSLKGHELVTLGTGVDLFTRPVPPEVASMTLAESLIGTRTGLCIVALDTPDGLISRMQLETVLPPGAQLVMMGTPDQRRAFTREFGAPKTADTEASDTPVPA